MENYRTKDLYEAAFLYASGKKLTHSENDFGKIWFVFGDQPSCRALSDSFWGKEARVNAKEFADSIRTLKDLIFNRTGK